MSRTLTLLLIAGGLLIPCTTVHGQGLQAEYFTNMTLTGDPVLTRVEAVDFDWGGNSPDNALGADNFSVRWTGSITVPVTGEYIFGTRTDDGVRLWVGPERAINNWSDHGATWNRSSPISLKEGVPIGIKLEFYENGGSAVMELYWSGPGIAEEPIPAEVLTPTYTVPVKAYKPIPADGMIGLPAPLLEWSPGETAYFHSVYLGTEPNLTEADLVSARQIPPLYYHVMGLTPGGAYYWRVDEIEKDGVTTHAGDVWSFVAQDVKAYYPNPTDGSNNASVTAPLTWMPGASAVGHQVYFSADKDAVSQGAASADKGAVEFQNESVEPGTLDSLSTYYWRVDEDVSGSTVTGSVWTFTTHLPVDDFESYTDDEGSRIYETWIDGWTNGTGATVGYLQSPFAEQTIIHGGLQSMPLDFNNADSPFYSEAEQEFASTQDWAAGGVDEMILFVRGRAQNSPTPIYVAVEDSSGQVAVVTHPDTSVVSTTKWTEWKIPLADFAGANLGRVKKLYLGLGSRTNPTAGGAGMVYIDDISVVKPAPTE